MFTDTKFAERGSSAFPEPDLPLFAATPHQCDVCFSLGYRIAPQGHVEQCPTLQLGGKHPEISPAGKLIDRAIRLLLHRKLGVDARFFDIARTIAGFSSAKPCSADELVRRHFSWVKGNVEAQRRHVTRAIKFLRDIWMLPIGAQKERPSGYYFCTNEAEFKEYVDRAKREPITELSTFHRMAKANWPVFAEQLEIDFWSDFRGVEDFLAKTEAALEFIPEGSAIPYDIGSSGIAFDDANRESVSSPPPELSR